MSERLAGKTAIVTGSGQGVGRASGAPDGINVNVLCPLAVFLASDDARYVTGQTLPADGGGVMVR